MARAIEIRKLAAIDIFFLGRRIILAEFAAGVFLPAGLGVFTLFRAHSSWQVALGLYLTSLSINYVPLLVYAIAIGNREDARLQLGDELSDKQRAMAKYRRVSLLLLIPLLVAILAAAQKLSRSHEAAPHSR